MIDENGISLDGLKRMCHVRFGLRARFSMAFGAWCSAILAGLGADDYRGSEQQQESQEAGRTKDWGKVAHGCLILNRLGIFWRRLLALGHGCGELLGAGLIEADVDRVVFDFESSLRPFGSPVELLP